MEHQRCRLPHLARSSEKCRHLTGAPRAARRSRAPSGLFRPSCVPFRLSPVSKWRLLRCTRSRSPVFKTSSSALLCFAHTSQIEGRCVCSGSLLAFLFLQLLRLLNLLFKLKTSSLSYSSFYALQNRGSAAICWVARIFAAVGPTIDSRHAASCLPLFAPPRRLFAWQYPRAPSPSAMWSPRNIGRMDSGPSSPSAGARTALQTGKASLRRAVSSP